MVFQKAWHGALSYNMANQLHFDYCDPETSEVCYLIEQFKDKVNGKKRDQDFDAFISHEWGVHKIAKQLAIRLEKEYKLKIWLDEKQVMGDVDQSMAEGIDGSKIFLVLATKKYMRKVNSGDRRDNCLKEFSQASSLRADRIVVAAMEEDMLETATQWTGRFQLALTRQEPVNLSTISDEAIERLAEAICRRIDTPEASSDLTPLMRDIYPRLCPCNSDVWAKGKAAKFTQGTRSWILDELCNWYTSEKSKVFILLGDGGVGKSVIMAELCHRGDALRIGTEACHDQTDKINKLRRKSSRIRSLWRRSAKERPFISVAAFHFFRHDDGTAASPTEAILSIAWQLCRAIPGFDEVLEEEVNFEGLRAKSLADLFKTLLVVPLSNPRFKSTPRQVVVLDALDECSKSDELLRKVVRAWKEAIPTWLSLVVSTRPEAEIERAINNISLDNTVLELQNEENSRDIKLHIVHLLEDMKDIVEQDDVRECAEFLSERSEGLFLWASFLPETLKRAHEKKHNGQLTMRDILENDAIPNGLGGMFDEYFERLYDKVGGADVYKALLAPIVAAREPLSVKQLSVALGKSHNEMADIVDDARNLLYKGSDGRVALIHKRMADWLSNRELSGSRLSVDVTMGHAHLAEYCRGTQDSEFALRHAIFHCVKSGELGKAFALLNNFTWVKRVISIGSDEDQRHATIGYLLRDCAELGINFAPESDTPRLLSKAVHALSFDPNELASQVLARFGHDSKNPLVLSMEPPDAPWLDPLYASLPHARDPLQHVLIGHSSGVMSVAIQDDTIVSGGADNTVRIWNAKTGREQRVLEGHNDSVKSVAIDGDIIVSGSDDETVRTWNAKTGEEQHVLKGHTDAVRSVAIEGDLIVSGSWDETVRTWNAKTGEEQHVLKGHSGPVSSVAIDRNVIVYGSWDETMCIWNAKTGEEQHVLNGHFDMINSVAIEGDTIVSGSNDQTVEIWNATSGEEQHVLTGHFDSVYSVAIEGDIIVSGSEDKTVRIWDAKTGVEQHVLEGHSEVVNSVAIQGDTIVSGSWDNTVRIWNASSSEEERNHEKHLVDVQEVAFEGDFIVYANDEMVRIWDARLGEELRVLEGHYDTVASVAIDGDLIVSGSWDETVRTWSARSGEQQHKLGGFWNSINTVAIYEYSIVFGSRDNTVRFRRFIYDKEDIVLRGHLSVVNSVAIGNDGGIIVSGSDDKTVRIWDTWREKELHVLRGHFGAVYGVAIEGDVVVSGSCDKTVRIWNAKTGEEQRVLEGHTDEVNSVTIYGDMIVSGSDDKTVRIWNAETGEEQRVLKGHTDAVSSVAIHSDMIVSGSNDNTVRIWNAETGEGRQILEGHSDRVNSVAIEGNMIVSGSDDETVRIWNADTGEEQHVLDSHCDWVFSVAIYGSRIVSGSDDNTVRVWDFEFGEEEYCIEGTPISVQTLATKDGAIVSGLSDGTVRTWSAETGEKQHLFKGHSDWVVSVAIENDIIVSGSHDMTVRVWNAKTGKEQHVFEGHSGRVSSVAIHGGIIVSGSWDMTVRIWDAKTGEPQHVLEGHTAAVEKVTIEGDTIISQASDRTRYWKLSSGKELNAGEEREFRDAASNCLHVDGGTHVESWEGVGFTTDSRINFDASIRCGDLYFVVDDREMLHILRGQR
ncbi:Guanine nucleotide-binding protein subunit beta-1 [Hondaea fermentalgiana]|uniref:Guanine nucleotide-binding protein subunit beta-1 n=1 Tax=Hondaea fermentalgiana TaxID=2315210 RepID=A0A2R5GIE7_9STRA|nr:Guanine nucleotide-binding protein subunit beta-1 [Hondaea fermentalgiana]|eukprot:GBG30089.1 Guanine nucleotide-binding protein subunit beta-1 [Hondaea fermentalgiana]